MSKPTFLGALAGKRTGKHELVHVESGAVLASRVDTARDSGSRRRGLLGHDPAPMDYARISAPRRIVQTCFMRVPIDAVFVAADGTVIRTCRGVRPWRIVGALRAFAAIEAPAGFVDRSEIAAGDRVTLREAQLPRPARDVTLLRSLSEAGLEDVPDAVRDAVRGSVPDAVSDADSDADPWGVDVAEAVRVDVPGPRDPAGRAAGEGPTPRTAGAGAQPRVRSSTSVDLARLLARQTPIVWFEAVAIVQELCAEVVARGPERDLRVPGLAEIAITREGGIELYGDGGAEAAPVSQAGRVLLTLLAAGQTFPVPLRLLALQEVSAAPSCRSLREFSTRLERFERPNRRTIVGSVYDRFQTLPALEVEKTEDGPPPLQLPVTNPRPVSPAWWQSARVQAGAGITAAVVVVTTALWLWPGPKARGAGDGRSPTARAVSATVTKVVQAARGGLRAVSRGLGLASDPPAAAVPAEPATVDAKPTSSAPPRRTARRTARPNAVPGAAGAIPETNPPGTDTTVYSPADPDIVPPRFVRTRLPKEAPPGVRPEDVPEVEVIVSAMGEAESVRLLTKPSQVGAAMMLSAVKNWRFEPAMRDGRPVRYRMRLRLTNQ